MEPGGSCLATAPSGCRRRSRVGGCRTARVHGRSIRSTAGPGWTPHPGAGRRITMAAGCPWMGSGRGRRGPWWCGRSMRPPSSPSSAGPGWAWASVSAGRSWAGCRSDGGSRSCRGGGGAPLGGGERVGRGWGREGFIHEPSWRGWGGPRVVNNTVINNTTVVNVQNINVYHNSNVQNAVVVVDENHFGHGPITSARTAQVDVTSLRPTHTAPQIATTPASFVPTASRGVRPPEGSVQRPVVATRPPHARSEAAPGGARNVGPAGVPTPAPRLVSVPPRPESGPIPTRPAFGQSTVERPTADRAQPPLPPGAPKSRPSPPQPQQEPQKATSVPTARPPSPG